MLVPVKLVQERSWTKSRGMTTISTYLACSLETSVVHLMAHGRNNMYNKVRISFSAGCAWRTHYHKTQVLVKQSVSYDRRMPRECNVTKCSVGEGGQKEAFCRKRLDSPACKKLGRRRPP